MTRAHRIVVVGLFFAALTACAGGAADDTGAPSPTPPTTTGSIDGTANGGDDVDPIDSVHWGPDDPPIPGEYAAFAVDAPGSLDCGAIDEPAEDSDFWALAAAVCRVFTGAGAWPDASVVLPPPSEGTNSYERCLDGELYDMLERAIAWHEAHPDSQPVVRYPTRGTHSPCQMSLYDVGLTDIDAGTDRDCDNDELVDMPALGVPVKISAPGITEDEENDKYEDPRATVDGVPLCVIADSEDDALRTFVVVVPTSGEQTTVTIVVETNYGMLSTDVELPAVGADPTETSIATNDGTSTSTDGVTTTSPTTSSDAGQGVTDTTDEP